MKEEGLKAIQPKTFVPKTTNSRGVKAAPNLLKDLDLTECAPTKIIIGERDLYSNAKRQILLFGGLAG